MKIHTVEAIEISAEQLGIEYDRSIFEAAIYLIEILPTSKKLKFPANQIKNPGIGFWVITALKAGTLGGDEILESEWFDSSEPAFSGFFRMRQQWDWRESYLPAPVKDGAWKIVNTFNGGESQERYATEADAEKVRQYNKHEFYSIPGSQNNIFCEIVIDAEAVWDWDAIQNKYRWFPKPVSAPAAIAG